MPRSRAVSLSGNSSKAIAIGIETCTAATHRVRRTHHDNAKMIKTTSGSARSIGVLNLTARVDVATQTNAPASQKVFSPATCQLLPATSPRPASLTSESFRAGARGIAHEFGIESLERVRRDRGSIHEPGVTFQ